MSTRDEQRWLKYFGRGKQAKVHLLCFHHAGGNASMYRDWPGLMPESIQPVAVQLPGRLERFTEAPYDTMDTLLGRLVDVLRPLLGQPFAFYGASMGARVAWALTHTLRERDLPLPRKLYVASCQAPSLDEPHRAVDGSDSSLISYITALGGTPPEILADPYLLSGLLPALRADLSVLNTHAPRPTAPLDVPIRGFAGRADADAPPARMMAWRAETSACFDLNVVDGGHFFSEAGQRQATALISADLA